MSGIIFDSTKIKVYESLKKLCRYAGESEEWCDSLWMEVMMDEELYGELLYYMKNNTIQDRMKCHGYSLIDLFIWQMEQYNLLHDTGKNTDRCRKVDMVLRAFDSMAQLKKNPEEYVRRLKEGRGNDRL